MKIGLIKESKIPPDGRVPLTPKQCKELMVNFPGTDIVVETSEYRCYHDNEYVKENIEVVNDLDDCDIIMGIKEVAIEKLIPDKTYFFFSHTIKKQAYNKELIQSIIKKNIRLIDYECLKYESGDRILGFGRFAGIVGAHNSLCCWNRKSGEPRIKRAYECAGYQELIEIYKTHSLPSIKIVLTGGGSVAEGAIEFFDKIGVRQIDKHDFLKESFSEAVFTQLDMDDYYIPKDNGQFSFDHFINNSGQYYCNFSPYAKVANVMINGIFWKKPTPPFFTLEDMQSEDFNIKVIADVTCDIRGSVPATLRVTTKDDPVYGFDPVSGEEILPYQKDTIDIMAVDNLPSELPRDSSKMFGEMLLNNIVIELCKDNSEIIDKATITEDGNLTPDFEYLRDYIS